MSIEGSPTPNPEQDIQAQLELIWADHESESPSHHSNVAGIETSTGAAAGQEVLSPVGAFTTNDSETDKAGAKVAPADVATPNKAPSLGVTIEQMQAKTLRAFSRVERWLEPENVLNLQDTIDTTLRKRTQEAHLLGDHYQVGFNRQAAKSDITHHYLEKYFGASSDELDEGKKVPQWVQSRVADLLETPTAELEQIAKKVKTAGPQNRDAINEFIFKLDEEDLASRDEQFQNEITYVTGRNAMILNLPLVQEAISEIADRRDEELYFAHEVKQLAKQKRHSGAISGEQIRGLAKATVTDMRAYQQAVERYQKNQNHLPNAA